MNFDEAHKRMKEELIRLGGIGVGGETREGKKERVEELVRREVGRRKVEKGRRKEVKGGRREGKSGGDW